jgi:hypothetical protein
MEKNKNNSWYASTMGKLKLVKGEGEVLYVPSGQD